MVRALVDDADEADAVARVGDAVRVDEAVLPGRARKTRPATIHVGFLSVFPLNVCEGGGRRGRTAHGSELRTAPA